jgi:hypothetical protein
VERGVVKEKVSCALVRRVWSRRRGNGGRTGGRIRTRFEQDSRRGRERGERQGVK